ncbi:MAG: nuclease A inhibitor family protein [Cyanobacteria bacterium J06581_3]
MTIKRTLKVKLEEVCNDLWWSSESDYPVEVVWVEGAAIASKKASTAPFSKPSSQAAIRNWLLSNVEKIEDPAELKQVDIEDFFERAIAPKSWHTTEDKAQIAQLRQLKELLERSLQPLQVYRYGKVEVLVYVLGHTPESDIAGVKTCLVET